MDRTAEDVCTVADSSTALTGLIDRAALRLEKETRELALKRLIAAALPTNLCLAPVALHAGGYKCDARLKFTMTARHQAVALLAQLPAVDVVLLRGACVSLIPKCRFADEPKAGQRVVDIAPVHFNFEGYGGGYSTEDFTWWTQLGEHVVQVIVQLERTAAGGVRVQSIHGSARHVERYQWSLENVPAGCYIDWAGGVDAFNPGKTTFYFETGGDLTAKMLSCGRHSRCVRA